MTSLATITFVIAALLVFVSLTQPAAERLHLPYTVLLAVLGVAIGGFSSAVLYIPLEALNAVAAPLANLPFSASVFLVVFLPILLFHASLTIDIREMAADAAPILLLAIVAVFVAALGVGFTLHLVAGVPLVVALLLGAIVATTDPAAVVGIFRDLGAPARLTRLVEGESLLNDAAAIVLFSVLLEMLTNGTSADITEGLMRFAGDFLGGIAFGFVGGRLFGAILPFLGGSRLAEVTLSLALPYLIYLTGEEVLQISGVVAVVSAGLTFSAIGRARLPPHNWAYLEQVWDQTGFWAGSLIFISASILTPKLMADFHLRDLWLLLVLIVAALVCRGLVLFGMLPILSALRLSQSVSNAFKLTITWGGLRGAVTLALALAVTENPLIDPAAQGLIAVLATGFVLWTLLVNGLTLRPLIRVLGLDRLSPVNQALRDKIVALSLAEVHDAVKETAEAYELPSDLAASLIGSGAGAAEEAALDSGLEAAITNRDQIMIGLVALANHERRLILAHHAQQTVSRPAIERLLRNTNLILDGAKAEGRLGYKHAARRALRFSSSFRLGHLLHRRLGIDWLLQRQISIRLETLLVRGLVVKELSRFNRQRLGPLLGERIVRLLGEIIAARSDATARAIEALRLQYPEHATALQRRFLKQTGLRLQLSLFGELFDEGLIGRELHDALSREHAAERRRTQVHHPLDLGLRTEDLIARVDVFSALNATDLKALARLFRSRLALPEETIIRKGDRGTQVFLISSGAVEVVLPHQNVRLGRGEFFGEMALLSGKRRQADVVSLGYCRLLVLTGTDFRRFLKARPEAKAEVYRIVRARTLMNERGLLPATPPASAERTFPPATAPAVGRE
ncbi:MAG: Transporter, family [Rhodospirillales bacterium]|nr:Transporter, family [Rhodospirillales bacterium]